jgi:hypothetical protein
MVLVVKIEIGAYIKQWQELCVSTILVAWKLAEKGRRMVDFRLSKIILGYLLFVCKYKCTAINSGARSHR